MLNSRCIVERITVDANTENLIEILRFIHKRGYWLTQEIAVGQLEGKDYYTIVAEKHSSQIHEDTDGSLEKLKNMIKGEDC